MSITGGQAVVACGCLRGPTTCEGQLDSNTDGPEDSSLHWSAHSCIFICRCTDIWPSITDTSVTSPV